LPDDETIKRIRALVSNLRRAMDRGSDMVVAFALRGEPLAAINRFVTSFARQTWPER
jgi:hypothetical protein